MSEKFVVGYDGSDVAKRALDFAVSRAQAQGGSILIVHVLEWSPYSFLTPEEIEERHARRKEELDRAEKALMAPLKATIAAAGVPVETQIKYGHVAKTLCEVAKKEGATQMVIGRDGDGGLSSRVFGSVAGSLVQVAPVPCTIVP
ncbi:universal stress protein [Marivita sp.]|jgi:nucleotide-binding universal stress UspA family protein|uniref:universal stress protein n=1 Tax=Marivita sp. TaxID=2003365 RepID=UPI00260EFA46|nr:universal stress protein [Marivita sp.]